MHMAATASATHGNVVQVTLDVDTPRVGVEWNVNDRSANIHTIGDTYCRTDIGLIKSITPI